MYFLIGADFVPTKSNWDLFSNGDVDTLLGKELRELLEGAMFRVFNLEVPLTDEETPIPKCGPNLIAPRNCIKGYRDMKVDIMTLANNHILDQGKQGLRSTFNLLRENRINYFGAGENIEEARKPFYFMFSEKKVGIIGYCQHEFSVAGNNTPGANLFDPIESFEYIQDISNHCDFLIVLYHGGIEHYRYPTPYLQKICRKMIDKGAALIVCQHSHCVGTIEKYGNGTIVYGQGNFLFDHQDNEFWENGVLVKVNEKFKVSYIPVMKKKHTVRMADDMTRRKVLNGISKRSEEILEDGFIENQLKEFAILKVGAYLGMFGGVEPTVFRVLNKLLGNRLRECRVKRKYRKQQRLMIKNYIECEAHREVIISGLEG